MVNNWLDKTLAEKEMADGADLFAFGRPFVGNPDLAARLEFCSPFVESDKATDDGAQGYTDDPALSA